MHASTVVDSSPDPRLERVLRHCVAVGALLVLAVPAARGHSSWLGALPLWLLAMPLVSWWALHRFRLPRLPRAPKQPARQRGRSGAQASRRRARRHPAFARAA
jgi:hypothetical protein